MKTLDMKFICENDNIRITEELKRHVSRRLYKKIKSTNAEIYINGEVKQTYLTINKGDIIQIKMKVEKEISWPIYESDLDIKYEDENYLVVNKRAGLLCIPTMSEPFSLYQEVLYYLKNNNLPLTCSILNRLDKETQGLCVIAKNRLAASYMSPTHEKMIRKYKCLCEGHIEKTSGRICNYIYKDENSNKRFISNVKLDNSQIAISNYKVLKYVKDNTLVEFILETGRTHQIRVHCKSIKHPIIGDKLYGDGDGELKLLSYYVKFHNEFTNKDIEIEINCDYDKE